MDKSKVVIKVEYQKLLNAVVAISTAAGFLSNAKYLYEDKILLQHANNIVELLDKECSVLLQCVNDNMVYEGVEDDKNDQTEELPVPQRHPD